MVKWVRVLKKQKKLKNIERTWEVLSENGSERVLEPWGVGVLGAGVLDAGVLELVSTVEETIAFRIFSYQIFF